MSGRLLLVLAAAPVAGGAALVSEGRAPTTTRYRIESKTEQVVDLSAVGQGTQTNNFTQVAILSVTLNDTTGGKVLHVVIDSIASDSPVPGVAEMLQKAKKAWLHGLVDSWGRTKMVATSADSNEIVGQLRNSLVRFFPVVKPGTSQGDSWVDTNKVDTKTPQQNVKTTTVTTYTRGGNEPRDGETATRIDAVSATTGAGTMENPMAGTMEVEINNSGTETLFISADGRYLGGTSKSDGKSMIRTPAVPDPIPVKVTSSTTITVVK
jgi:hypothetical protein